MAARHVDPEAFGRLGHLDTCGHPDTCGYAQTCGHPDARWDAETRHHTGAPLRLLGPSARDPGQRFRPHTGRLGYRVPTR